MRAASGGGAVLLAVALSACGDVPAGPTPAPAPTPTPSPTPIPPQVVAERTGFFLEAGWIGWLPFPTSRAGSLEATVDWTYASNNLDVYLVKGECNYDQLYAGQCETLASSDSPTAKPEKVRLESAPAGTYTIFVDNLGPGDESLSFQVILTAGPAASAARRSVPLRPDRRPRGQVAIP
jgi:hypothetical protein